MGPLHRGGPDFAGRVVVDPGALGDAPERGIQFRQSVADEASALRDGPNRDSRSPVRADRVHDLLSIVLDGDVRPEQAVHAGWPEPDAPCSHRDLTGCGEELAQLDERVGVEQDALVRLIVGGTAAAHTSHTSRTEGEDCCQALMDDPRAQANQAGYLSVSVSVSLDLERGLRT